MRSIYHVRQFDIFRLMQLAGGTPIDVFLAHDWPRGIVHHGDLVGLLRRKAFLRKEIEHNTFGNPATMPLLNTLQPTHWFGAHMHCRFSAVVKHGADGSRTTNFLALDKCLPKRQFLEIIDIEPSNGCKVPVEVCYDAQWLAIVRRAYPMMSFDRRAPDYSQIAPISDLDALTQQVVADFQGDLRVPLNFAMTAPAYDPTVRRQGSHLSVASLQSNPQTDLLLKKLALSDRMACKRPLPNVHANPDEITIDSDSDADDA